MVQHVDTDILVLGSGGAGLRAAIEAEKQGVKVTVVSKSSAGMMSASVVTNGYFKVAVGGATKEEHYRATVDAGKGLSDPELVKVLVEEGPERVTELDRFGVTIQTLRGMASCGDDPQVRGLGFIQPMVKYLRDRGVEFVDNCIISKLLTDGDRVIGAVGFKEEPMIFSAKATVLGTGGCGAIYPRTDCPATILGDGYSLAYEAGASLRDMEFTQFVPVGLAEKAHPLVIIYGDLVDKGRILNSEGEDVVAKYRIMNRPLTTMARDQLSVAMMREILDGRGIDGAVQLDAVQVIKERGLEKLVAVDAQRKALIKAGIEEKPIKIAPVSHFTMGGVQIKPDCSTGVTGLFAAGEVTGGVHGANRIGGNAMTEIIVFGARAGASAAAYASKQGKPDLKHLFEPELREYNRIMENEPLEATLPKLKKLMWAHVGVVRNGQGLSNAIRLMNEQEASAQCSGAIKSVDVKGLIETRLAIKTARLVADSALTREESRGTHFRTDYSEQLSNWNKPIIVKYHNK